MHCSLDVRDMLCAQALAQTDAAVKRLAPGETLDVCCNSPDVVEDVLVWAKSLGHDVVADVARGKERTIRLRRMRG